MDQTNLQESRQAARDLFLGEFREYGGITPDLYFMPAEKGIELAKKLSANEDVVEFGCLFMDIKIGQAVKEGRVKDHIQMSLDFANEFFKAHNFTEDFISKVNKCIVEHHGDKGFSSLESEICANADCYKFIHPKGVFAYFSILGERSNDSVENLEQAQLKLEEKYKAITLTEVKAELSDYHQIFKKLFEDARNY